MNRLRVAKTLLTNIVAMNVTIRGRVLELAIGDISAQVVDAIVNAANTALAGGGGVDGAIHRAGGPMIMEETQRLYPDGCPTGSAVISGAGRLRAKHVIHAVGPFWHGGRFGEAIQLASAYQASLQLAAEHGCRTVALPALSTGAYRYPMDEAAQVAIGTTAGFLRALDSDSFLEVVRFVLFSADTYAVFEGTLAEIEIED
jgi:O-acetyl-ADP-ribose deacetylase (regulator of RNase III)